MNLSFRNLQNHRSINFHDGFHPFHSAYAGGGKEDLTPNLAHADGIAKFICIRTPQNTEVTIIYSYLQ